MTNQFKKGGKLKNKLQHNAAYLLHTIIEMLHTGFCYYNWLYQTENSVMGEFSHERSI